MKEFNLELAKAGHPVQTRDGRKARIICFDRKDFDYPLMALVETTSGDEICYCYTENGHFSYDVRDSELDLVMASDKHEGWINLYRDNREVYPGRFYKTKEDAEQHKNEKGSVATAKVEWKE